MEKVRQLLAACEDGDKATVQLVLDGGLDVNAVDDDDTTALQVAATNGHEHLVRLLLMRGAALDIPNKLGWNPLLLAARYGHASVVNLLLQNQADVNAETKLAANALTLAARGGHLQVCKQLIEAGIDLSLSTRIGDATCEFTALMTAAHHGHDTVVRYLIDRGFDINYRMPSSGVNALMLAALNGHMATSQILIERGADPNLTNCNNATPLRMAELSRKREVTGYLDRKTTNKPKQVQDEAKLDIVEAAKKADFARVKECLDQDLSQRDTSCPQDGATPLMYAAMMGRLDMVQYLVERGADFDKQDTVSGWTALMQATYHGRKGVAKYLINAGANVLLPAKNGCTAFDLASLIDDVDTELYRLLGAKAAQVPKPQASASTATLGRRQTGKQANGTLSSAMSMDHLGEVQPKSGLKRWWNRMSTRFRNLKLGGTMKTSKLTPAPSMSSIDVGSSELGKDAHTKTLPLPRPSSGNARRSKKTVSADALGSTNASDVSSINTNYSQLLMSTRKSASMFALPIDTAATTTGIPDHNSGKTPIPPFFPPPSFEDDRPKMPPPSSRRSVGAFETSSLVSPNPIIPAMKMLKTYDSPTSASTQDLAAVSSGLASPRRKPVAPTQVSKENHTNDISPSSSGGASHLTSGSKQSRDSKGPSSASSSTLTAGSDIRFIQVNPYPDIDNAPSSARAPRFLQQYQQLWDSRRHVHSSYTSSVSGVTSFSSVSRTSKAKSNSSKESQSTLTPTSAKASQNKASSPKTSMTSVTEQTSSKSSDADSHLSQSDGLGGILKKLSLEGYQPIFEEQEVDMEAFLMLSEKDLKELGITQQEPRRQILAVISELQSGKGREKQQYQDTMRSFNNKTNNNSKTDMNRWSLETEPPLNTSQKSRSS